MALTLNKKNNRQTPRIKRQAVLSTFGRFSGFLSAALAAKTKHLVRDGAKIRRRSLWDVRSTFLLGDVPVEVGISYGLEWIRVRALATMPSPGNNTGEGS